MSNTAILGSDDAVLGLSFLLAAGATGGPVVTASASNALILTHSVTYVGPRALSVSQAISLSQAATYGRKFELSVSHSLTVTQAAPQPTGKRTFIVHDPITLTSTGDTRIKLRTSTATIALVQTVAVVKAKHVRDAIALTDRVDKGLITLTVHDTIALTQVVRTPIKKSVAHTISLTQTTRSSMKKLAVADAIAISEVFGVQRPWHLSVVDPLEITTPDTIDLDTLVITPAHTSGLSDGVTVNRRQPYTSHQYISLLQTVGVVRIKAGAIAPTITAQTISLTQSARRSIVKTQHDHLTITQAVVVHRATPVASAISLSQSVGRTLRRNPSPTDAIPISDALAFVVIRGNTLHTYTPFVGAGIGSAPSGTLPALPGLPGGVRFRLEHPYTSPSDTVDLDRAPVFGNRDRLQFTRINRTTRGGTLIVFADPIWPKAEQQVFSFAALSATQASTLQTFMHAHVGKEIALYDHEGRKWRGVITNPNDPVVQDGRGSFSASFEFEGTVV